MTVEFPRTRNSVKIVGFGRGGLNLFQEVAEEAFHEIFACGTVLDEWVGGSAVVERGRQSVG